MSAFRAAPLLKTLVLLVMGAGLALWNMRWINTRIASTSANGIVGVAWLIVSMMFSSMIAATMLGGIHTAVARSRCALLLHAPWTHARLWRNGIVSSARAIGIGALPSLIWISWRLGQIDPVWILVLLLWCMTGVLVGTVAIVALAGARSHLRSRLALTATVPFVAALTWTSRQQAVAGLSPWTGIADPLLFIALLWWLGAERLGRWYVSVAQSIVNAPQRVRSWLGPLPELVACGLRDVRSPVAAIVIRDVRVQARDPFILVRAALLTITGVGWHFGHQTLSPSYLTLLLLMISGSYGLLEITPSPIGGEGERILTTMTAPISPHHVLLGKALPVVAMNALQVVLGALLLNIIGAPTTRALPLSLIVTIGASIGTAGLSALDMDARAPMDGSLQALLTEHLPLRAWRVVSVGLAGAMIAISIISTRAIGGFTGILCVLLMTTALAAVGWKAGLRRLNQPVMR